MYAGLFLGCLFKKYLYYVDPFSSDTVHTKCSLTLRAQYLYDGGVNEKKRLTLDK